MRTASTMPSWVAQQARLQSGQVGFLSKPKIIRRYALELRAAGEVPTHGKIRAMLRALRRNYRMSAAEISFALEPLYRNGRLERYPNGARVEVAGKPYRSIRAAARGEGCAVETVRKRIAAGRAGWRYRPAG